MWLLLPLSASGAQGGQLRIGMQGQRFSPARVVATVGDTLRFDMESGGPHNVGFDPDSIPPGALEALARKLGSEPRFLVTPEMLLDRGETFLLSLEGLPPGRYVFHCTPHLGNGMRGELVLQARTATGAPQGRPSGLPDDAPGRRSGPP